MRVMTFGTFDLLHPGHLRYLEQARTKGDLIVIVARDETVKRIKGFAPAQDEQSRKTAIEKAFPNATVVLGDPDDYLAPLKAHKPDLLLLGYDQRLPPGIDPADLPPVERAKPHEPETYKSSLLRKQ